MAGTVNTAALRTGRALIAAALCCLGLPALAMGAAAPFVPPQVQAATAPAVEGSASAPTPGGGSGLAGIRLGRQPLALIDGQWLAPGATVRGATLVAIGAGTVQLREPGGGLQILLLAPQVELQPLRPDPPTAPSTRTARSAVPHKP